MVHPTKLEFDAILNQFLGERVAGRPKQDIDVASDIQNYKVGTRLQVGECVFYYAKAGGAINRTDLGVKNGLPQGIAQRSLAADAPVGAKSVVLTTTAADGAAGTGLILKDEFAGGYIVFFQAGLVAPVNSWVRKVTGNTARIAGGSLPVTFTFDIGLAKALTTSDVAEVMASPFAHVVLDTRVDHAVVGLPTVLATLGQYLWVQTWGPCWLSLQGTVGVAGELGANFRHDGSLDITSVAVGGLNTSQYAGFVLVTTASATQAAPFVMLQITP